MGKLNFLKTEFPKLTVKLNSDAKGNWGVLNAQQMVEHMSDSVSYATGKNNQPLHSSKENVGKYKEFAMSDKEFKPNTKNALMSETPIPTKNSTMQLALLEYEQQINSFINYFENNEGATITNPFFGDLNFDEWIHLLYKHAVHHCKQFGLV